MLVSDLTLEMTCPACPEQYNVLNPDGERVGYLRLRHGYFRADLEPSGKTVYDAETKGDGSFELDERELHLNNALLALASRL